MEAAAVRLVLAHCKEERAGALVVETVMEIERVDALSMALREAV